jgi:hypothetical protein
VPLGPVLLGRPQDQCALCRPPWADELEQTFDRSGRYYESIDLIDALIHCPRVRLIATF